MAKGRIRIGWGKAKGRVGERARLKARLKGRDTGKDTLHLGLGPRHDLCWIRKSGWRRVAGFWNLPFVTVTVLNHPCRSAGAEEGLDVYARAEWVCQPWGWPVHDRIAREGDPAARRDVRRKGWHQTGPLCTMQLYPAARLVRAGMLIPAEVVVPCHHEVAQGVGATSATE